MSESTEKRRKFPLASALVRIADTSPLDICRGVTSLLTSYRAHRAHKRAEYIAQIVRAIRE